MFPNFASVHPLNDNTVALHSLAPPPVWLQPITDFWAVLHGYDNQSLWDNFDCDGDGSWITDGMITGKLAIVHNGSYMKEVNPHVCSAAYMIWCCATGLCEKAQW